MIHRPTVRSTSLADRFWSALLGTTALTLLAAAPLAAVDGVIEIHQACVAAGCFPGDDPGFPVTITTPGSYRLTSILDVSGEADPENVTAVEIALTVAPEKVTIDLNGFGIRGATSCPNTPPSSCSPLGTGVGVSSNQNNITVRNGFIEGMGSHGIELVSKALVADVQVESCGGDGIHLGGNGSQVVGSVASRNWGDGIHISGPALVRDSLAVANHGVGLFMDAGPATAYGGNVLSLNAGADASGGVQISTNLCGSSPCS